VEMSAGERDAFLRAADELRASLKGTTGIAG
jgi:hypothetical protein